MKVVNKPEETAERGIVIISAPIGRNVDPARTGHIIDIAEDQARSAEARSTLAYERHKFADRQHIENIVGRDVLIENIRYTRLAFEPFQHELAKNGPSSEERARKERREQTGFLS